MKKEVIYIYEVCKKISLKVKNDKYLETIQRYEDELTDNEKEEIKNSSSILDFNRYNLTSLGICKLLKYYLDIEKIENEIIKLDKFIAKKIIVKSIEKLEKNNSLVDISSKNLEDIYNLITNNINNKKIYPRQDIKIMISKNNQVKKKQIYVIKEK